jgi:hypothetical protein
MGRTWSFRRLAMTASAVLLGCQPALAFPQGQDQVINPLPLSAWVVVNEAGIAATFSPIVRTTNGAATTDNPPPPTLMATATHTLLPSGVATTSTGLAPVATATGKNHAGIFLACDKNQSPGGRFCQPVPGTVMYVGYTYYVTWSPFRFPDGNTKVAVQITPEDGQATTSETFPASRGFWAWTIDNDFLRDAGGSDSISVEISILQEDASTPDDHDAEKHVGPMVYVTYPPPLVPVKGSSPSVVAIAVPVVVAVVVLLLAGLCFWSWRRHGTVPIVGALGKVRRRSSGYGVRKSASERVGRGVVGGGRFGAPSDKPGPNINIQLTDRDSWSPTGTGSRNVFREEVQRQERQR